MTPDGLQRRQQPGRKEGTRDNAPKDHSSKESATLPPLSSKSIDIRKNGGSSGFKEEDNNLHDPVSFWRSWSEKKAYCDQRNHNEKSSTCNCFEGVGSVM